jgi:circadian clock protein KaiC
MNRPDKLRRLTTGISGLDTVLGGGLFETGVYIVQGTPGAGKTIFANQICFHLAAQRRRAVYYTLLTESHDRMFGFLQGLSFFDWARIPRDLTYVSGFKVLESDGLGGIVRNLSELLERAQPAVLVIDGLATAEHVAITDTAFKKFLHELQLLSVMFHCTMLLLTSSDEVHRDRAEHTMVDGILTLSHEVVRLKPTRTLEVAKFRGANQLRGMHSVQITDAGITVHPRVETSLRAAFEKKRPTERERRGFGIAALDAMLAGGLPCNSNTMLMGPSGTGKTLLGLHFLDEGARRGDRGLLFTFYEHPEEIQDKANRLGLTALADGIERDLIELVWTSPVESNIDAIGNELLARYANREPTRIVLDGMHGFQATADPPERIVDALAALTDYFVTRGAGFMFTVETQDLLGDGLHMPFENASRMCQNIIAVRYREVRGRLARVLAIVKTRDSGFDNAVRELVVGDAGVEIHELPSAEEQE